MQSPIWDMRLSVSRVTKGANSCCTGGAAHRAIRLEIAPKGSRIGLPAADGEALPAALGHGEISQVMEARDYLVLPRTWPFAAINAHLCRPRLPHHLTERH